MNNFLFDYNFVSARDETELTYKFHTHTTLTTFNVSAAEIQTDHELLHISYLIIIFVFYHRSSIDKEFSRPLMYFRTNIDDSFFITGAS